MLVITPSKRPERINWIKGNWSRQEKDNNDELLIIWNGCENPKDGNIWFEEGSIAKSMNFAIDYAIKNGHDEWSCFDDDDWYGPGYLKEAKESLKDSIFSGKISKFLKTRENNIWLLKTKDSHPKSYGLCTISSKTNCLKFDESLNNWGVETEWCLKMVENNNESHLKGNKEFVYCIWDHEHTSRITELYLAAYFEEILDLGKQPFEISIGGTLPHYSKQVIFENNEIFEELKRVCLTYGELKTTTSL